MEFMKKDFESQVIWGHTPILLFNYMNYNILMEKIKDGIELRVIYYHLIKKDITKYPYRNNELS